MFIISKNNFLFFNIVKINKIFTIFSNINTPFSQLRMIKTQKNA